MTTSKELSTTETKNPGAAGATVPPNGGIEINGGILTRAPKSQNCTCKVPDMVTNAIEDGDEWTCSCGQGWRAKINPAFGPDASGASPDVKAPYWRRIAKRRASGATGSETASEPEAGPVAPKG